MLQKLTILFTRNIKRNKSEDSQVTRHAQGCFTFSLLVPMRLKKYRAFSFVEVIIIVLFLGVFAAIAVPRFNRAAISKNKAQTTARKIVSDLRLTRRLAISNAANNTVGFALWMDGPGGAGGRTFYQIRDRSALPPSVLEQHAIDSNVTVTSDTKSIRFGPLGNILESDTGFPSQVIVSAAGKICTIQLFIATGMVKCVEN